MADTGTLTSNTLTKQPITFSGPGTGGNQNAGNPMTPPAGNAANTPASTPAAGAADANAIMDQLLTRYGLGSLTAWALNEANQGASVDQITQDMYSTPQFKQRFPGIFERQAKGLPPISPADYISYEDSLAQMENQYGMPKGILTDAQTVGVFIGNDVSQNEVQSRVQQGYQAVAFAPQEVQTAFTQMFGVSGQGALASYFLDEGKATPLLLQQATAAQISGTASAGSVNMSNEDAMRLAQMGISPSQTSSAVQQLQQQAPLYNANVTEQNNLAAGTQGVEAQFGINAGATQEIIAREQARQAAFRGGGQAELTNQGAVGAGAAHPF